MSPEFAFYKPLITSVAEAHGLGPALVAAVVQTESKCRADAFRHEPLVWARYMSKSPEFAGLNPRRYGSAYGLMQPFWLMAVEDGLDRSLPPEQLFIPEQSLDYGCRRLTRCLTWASHFGANEKDTLLSALAAYNGGQNSAQAPPNPRNIKYALRVWQHLGSLA